MAPDHDWKPGDKLGYLYRDMFSRGGYRLSGPYVVIKVSKRYLYWGKTDSECILRGKAFVWTPEHDLEEERRMAYAELEREIVKFRDSRGARASVEDIKATIYAMRKVLGQ